MQTSSREMTISAKGGNKIACFYEIHYSPLLQWWEKIIDLALKAPVTTAADDMPKI